MNLRILFIALNFIFKLLKSKNFNLPAYLQEYYGNDSAKSYYSIISDSKKLEKSKLDLDFLLKCKTYDVIPKFLRFKLYKKSLHSSQFYKSWQIKLLTFEISSKTKRISELEELLKQKTTTFYNQVSYFDQIRIRSKVKAIVESFRLKTYNLQKNKLQNLGVYNDLLPVDPSKVVHNFSSVKIPEKIKFLLAFGLQFNLPVFHLNFYKYFHPLEKIAQLLKHEPCVGERNVFLENMRNCVNKFYYNFKPSKVFSSIFRKQDIELLKSFAADHHDKLVVSKPDKGRGVVIVDKPTYINSMTSIISDQSKFSPISENILKYCFKIEDKINRFLLKIKKLDIITPATYSELYASGSGPGVLYGLPKIHKPDFHLRFQYRPILAAFKLASFNMCKFLVPILAPLTTNEYTIDNSEMFANYIQSVPNASHLFMTSFDVESLFTNIPLKETIEICAELLFSKDNVVLGFTKDLFCNFLELAVSSTFFIFNGEFYSQIDGVGMGLPLGPTLANIFMCHFETQWINSCPTEFKPVAYKRYVDDTFILFSQPSHAQLFLGYLNSKHSNIKFTMESESNFKLSFLDVCVQRNNNSFHTSVFRKDTFSGLGLSYFSFCCKVFKINSIKTLIHRAYSICSHQSSLYSEFNFLTEFFHCNGFPRSLVQKSIKNFLNNKLVPRDPVTTVPKKSMFLPILYFGHKSVILKIQLTELLNNYFPHLDVQIILVNPFTTGSFFNFKDVVPKGLRSSLVYKFRCVKNSVTSEYYGFTTRRLSTRVAEHRGISVRTGHLLVHPLHSSIRSHTGQCTCEIDINSFKIVHSDNSSLSLKILESLYILKNSPKLNESESSIPLILFR